MTDQPVTDAYNSPEKAELYDWEQQYLTHQNLDIPFYLQEAARWGGPVLELACGTGRIALPLARAGYEVVGLDASPAMLSLLRRKAAAEQLPVTAIEGNMARFNLQRKFRLIIMAFNALLLLPSLDLQRACLRSCRAHLAEDGALLVSIFPEHFWLYTHFVESDEFSFDWTRLWEERNLVVSQVSRQRRNPASRSTHWEGRLELIAPNGMVEIVEKQIVIRWDSRAELESLLQDANLVPVEWYGSYRRTPPDKDADRLIAVCR